MKRPHSWTALLALVACGESEPEGLTLPSIAAPFVVVGFAPTGRSVEPRLTQILPAGGRVPAPTTGGTVLDGFIGGLANEDLPAGLTVETLRFVPSNTDAIRRQPPLRRPHVLGRPALPEDLGGFVLIEAPTLDDRERQARQDRYDTLVGDIGAALPCVGQATEVALLTPRTPAEAYVSARAEGNDVWLGLVASGTVAVARFDLRTRQTELVGITAPDALMLAASQRLAVVDMGPIENGRPAYVVVDGGGGFEQLGFMLSWSEQERRWLDDTPLLQDNPVRSLGGASRPVIDGVPSRCVFGTVRNPRQLDAGLWCRTETSTTSWRLEFAVPEGQSITGVQTTASGDLIALDRRGAVHLRESGWRTLFTASINQGCVPACAPFDVAVADTARTLVLAGEDAQLLTMDLTSVTVPTRKFAVEAASFVDERAGGSRAHDYTAAARAPDGRWWLATSEGNLFRTDAELETAEQVCLPATLHRRAFTTIAAAQNGELLLGVAGGLVALTRWDR